MLLLCHVNINFKLFGQISLSESCSHSSAALHFNVVKRPFHSETSKTEEVLPEKGFQVNNICIFTGILDATYDLNGDFNRFSSFVSLAAS